MSYPKQTIQLRPRRGLSSDLPPWDVPPDSFTLGENVVFRMGIAERAPSAVAVYDPPTVAPYQLLNAQIADTNFWVYAGDTQSFAVQTSVHTEITNVGGQQSQTDTSKLTLGSLNGVPFFNNALDVPQYWDGNVANNFLDLPGWPASTSCRFMVAHRYHLFACGIDGPSGNFAEQVLWSDAAAPGNVPASWTAAATNEAGSVELADNPGTLISGANLRGSLVLYKDQSTHLVDYVGPQEIFAFRTAFAQAGALCRHAVADVNGQHLVVTDGDVIVHDGSSIRSIVQNRRKRYLFNLLDQTNFDRLFTVYHRAKNEVWICFPEPGESLCTRAMIYDIANDAWGDRELPGVSHAAVGIINDTAVDNTWDVDTEVWDDDLTIWNDQNFSLSTQDLVIAEPTTPALQEIGRGSQSLTSLVARYAMDFGQPERQKFIRRLHVQAQGSPSIPFTVRVGAQQTPEGDVTWTTVQTFYTTDGFVNVLPKIGRFVSVEISVTTTEAWKITGIDLEAEIRGYH